MTDTSDSEPTNTSASTGDPYTEGVDAFLDYDTEKLPVSPNPYDPVQQAPSHAEWAEGWADALSDTKEIEAENPRFKRINDSNASQLAKLN